MTAAGTSADIGSSGIGYSPSTARGGRRPDYWRKAELVARNKQWQRAHPERVREINEAARRRRRAKLAGADVSEVEPTEEYIAILRRDPCSYCGAAGGEIDHNVAVSAGGGHVWHNVTSACRS